MYLYRTFESEENTIDFHLKKKRNYMAAKCFFKKSCGLFMFQSPVLSQENKIQPNRL
ncbi:DDE-type integrase/transposase/recombinase [Bacillus cereus]|nr:DDE-type integrase/transposase/recombinase [Bacillus thuringiensis]MBE7098900.1 DDE-type integrase/transposase/recombinase [Bacillus cereus]MBL3774917.1 DDE-type integrase/transposase/recombinase [Bacillus cereus]MBL3780742.1 DDE-type integrase/transposase/recombinase [Bacillus cereus]MBL3792020.1 DDE-type integrase/transposase/recombinase [Bacillus cereus]